MNTETSYCYYLQPGEKQSKKPCKGSRSCSQRNAAFVLSRIPPINLRQSDNQADYRMDVLMETQRLLHTITYNLGIDLKPSTGRAPNGGPGKKKRTPSQTGGGDDEITASEADKYYITDTAGTSPSMNALVLRGHLSGLCRACSTLVKVRAYPLFRWEEGTDSEGNREIELSALDCD